MQLIHKPSCQQAARKLSTAFAKNAHDFPCRELTQGCLHVTAPFGGGRHAYDVHSRRFEALAR